MMYGDGAQYYTEFTAAVNSVILCQCDMPARIESGMGEELQYAPGSLIIKV